MAADLSGSVVLARAFQACCFPGCLPNTLHTNQSVRAAAQVMDNLVSSLGKFTVLLDPANAKAAVEFGNSEKARMACDAAFQLANRRAAWRPHRCRSPVF